MVRYYKICNKVIRVFFPDQAVALKDRILEPFQTENENYDHTLAFELVDELEKCRGELIFKDFGMQVFQWEGVQMRYIGALEKGLEPAYQCTIRQDDYSRVQIKKSLIYEGISNKMILNAMEAEHLIVQDRGILFHSSYINWNGNGILFTAPSGTGKSTQADLWCEYEEAELVNGDRSAVLVENETATVYGIPFSGSSGICRNVVSPLKAIVYLQQAPENTLVRLKGRNAFARVWEGCSVNVWNRDDMEKCSQTVMDIISKVPVYLLQCTPDQRAVELLKEELIRQV